MVKIYECGLCGSLTIVPKNHIEWHGLMHLDMKRFKPVDVGGKDGC